MNKFELIGRELLSLVEEWEQKLLALSSDVISERRNSQNRNIKQIVGHMVDSASNNIHRIVHLQYGNIPLVFPNYATHGNNDRWIAIQNYEEEDWNNLVQLWKFTNIHIVHVIQNINSEKTENKWMSGENEEISLEDMVVDFPRHFKLHLDEISELINK
ncbi:MAG: DinB family protein [Bacteroidales bacterium]|nr:MAG: DinB family protein [Bacteroidales bacterium]